jgi:hypothetical protein
MLTRKKSVRSPTKRPGRKRSKFVTPDLVLSGGRLIRFVANPDNPLSQAERLREEYAEMEDRDDAEERQFLQRAYFVATQFRQLRGDFERFQAHPFWKQKGTKPRDRSTSKWLLYFTMQATTTSVRKLAGKYATILDGLMQEEVESDAVARRIEELGGIDAAYKAMQVRKREDAQVSGTVAVAETAAAGRRTRRHDELSPRMIGPMLGPTKRPRRRWPQPTFPILHFPICSPEKRARHSKNGYALKMEKEDALSRESPPKPHSISFSGSRKSTPRSRTGIISPSGGSFSAPISRREKCNASQTNSSVSEPTRSGRRRCISLKTPRPRSGSSTSSCRSGR